MGVRNEIKWHFSLLFSTISKDFFIYSHSLLFQLFYCFFILRSTPSRSLPLSGLAAKRLVILL